MNPLSQDEQCPGGQAVEPHVAASVRYVPFVWQRSRRLALLHKGPDGWVVAELTFDPVSCRYDERRQAIYASPREAAGVMLARPYADDDSRFLLADRLSEWFLLQAGT